MKYLKILMQTWFSLPVLLGFFFGDIFLKKLIPTNVQTNASSEEAV